MLRRHLLSWLSRALLLMLAAASAEAQVPTIELVEVVGTLTRPTSITHAGDGSGRLFVTEQRGEILVLEGSAVRTTPFLDIDSISSCCNERGLLSVAFHPSYSQNGRFFVAYTDNGGDLVVARYTVSADPNVADPSSGLLVIKVAQPYANHNGGQIHFGPDGMLYIGTGDGGSAGDPQNAAQSLDTLLGKLLRIDVDSASPYAIPAGNPFVGVENANDEIWSYGLRNPWRFSFDRQTGDLFIGDVGQYDIEEIDFQPVSSSGGENYGWRRMEGTSCFNPSSGCDTGSLTMPIAEYNHGDGCAVTGGYRYRGSAFAPLVGTYIFGDYCSGRIWGTTGNPGAGWTTTLLLDTSLRITAFGEDEAGELYAVDAPAGGPGRILRLQSSLVTCDIAPSQPVFDQGELVSTSTLRVRNHDTSPIDVELKLWIGRPDQSSLEILKPAYENQQVTLAPGYDHDFGPTGLFWIERNETASGTYTLNCRLLDPTTGAQLVYDAHPFEVNP